MKTEELIQLLATDAGPVQAQAIERRFAVAWLVGIAGAGALMAGLFGVRHDLVQTMALPMFWGKLGFAAALAAIGLAALRRMARPGMAFGRTTALVAVPPLVLCGLAASVLAQADPGERMALVLGTTWHSCPFNIALLSVPAFVASFWALKGAAPTWPGWAGAGAGLMSGALGALVYALHCPEMASPFVAVWYLAGMALPTALGAVLGPRVLRW